MSALSYSEKVMEHFMNPRNVGEVENPDGVGEVGNPVCGDVMRITIRVAEGRIQDVKFKTLGCAAAIAVSSMTTEMAKGKTLDEALEITRDMVARELGGLPPVKMHCSNLAAEALHKAIESYRAKKGGSRAFTLIELLVVIAILGVLAAMLLPAIEQARHEASRVSCVGNLRQLDYTLFLYAQSNNEFLPVEPTEHNPHPGLMAALMPYSSESAACAMYYCPEASMMESVAQNPSYTPTGQTDTVIDTPANRAAGNISYVYWSFLSNKPIGWTSPAQCWRNPPDFVPRILTMQRATLVSTGAQIQNFRPAQAWLACDFFRQGAPFPHLRQHQAGLNILYLGGQVDLMVGRPRDNFR